MDLTARSLRVRRDGRLLLDGIDATFRPGRVTVVLGPNGAGKSTLVKTLAALIAPSSGEVRLGDRPVSAIEPRARARTIGYLPQDAAVHWNVTVREVVALGRLPHRSPYAAPSSADEASVDRALADTDTAGIAGRRVLSLSGGERARVLLARVLAGEPGWLIADEPLASLDLAHQLEVLALLRAATASRRGVVLVIHDLHLAARIGNDALLLAEGRVVAAGPVETVLTAPLVARAFGVEAEVGRTPGGQPFVLPLRRT